MTSSSRKFFAEARCLFPGGVNSPVRAFRAVGGEPFFVARGEGSRLVTSEGRSLIDYVCSWGALILGHADPRVVAAVSEAAAGGTSYGAPTVGESELGAEIVRAMPSLEMLRFVNSGTEATMSALRLARGFTKREKIVKFTGCYHGCADSLLVKAGSGALTFGIPDSAGVPADLARLTLTLPYNDLDAVQSVFREQGREIAAVIVEPVAANMGVVPPRPGFLAGLKEITVKEGALLIFDEVITGFRVSFGGAQQVYGISADLTCLGKIIGGGLPVGAYGGRREIMEQIAPLGPVYQAGTLSGNPLAMRAGLETLRALAVPGIYSALEEKGRSLAEGLLEAANRARVPLRVNRVGSLLTPFFTEAPVVDAATAARADTARYARFFHALLAEGIFLAPSQFEAAFLSTAHTSEDLATTRAAISRSFASH